MPLKISWCVCVCVHRAIESRAPDYYSSESQQLLVQQESEHLTEAHLLYFSHWLLLCALETHTMERKGGRHNIWLQSAQERSGRNLYQIIYNQMWFT